MSRARKSETPKHRKERIRQRERAKAKRQHGSDEELVRLRRINRTIFNRLPYQVKRRVAR